MRWLIPLAALTICAESATAQQVLVPQSSPRARAIPLGIEDQAVGIHFDVATGTAFLSGYRDLPWMPNEPFVWEVDSTDQITPILLGLAPGGTSGDALLFSHDGSFLAGSSDSSRSHSEAIIWTYGDWQNPDAAGWPTGGISSAGYMPSDLGQLVGVAAPAFIWPPMTELLGFPFSGQWERWTASSSTSWDGSLISGVAVEPSLAVWVPCTWSWNGASYDFQALPIPTGQVVWSSANASSPSGDLIVGDFATPAEWRALVWENRQFEYVPDDAGSPLNGRAVQATSDGAVFGWGEYGSGVTQAFLWNRGLASMSETLDDYFTRHNAYRPPPTSFTEISQVKLSDGRYHIVAYGVDGLSYYVSVPAL